MNTTDNETPGGIRSVCRHHRTTATPPKVPSNSRPLRTAALVVVVAVTLAVAPCSSSYAGSSSAPASGLKPIDQAALQALVDNAKRAFDEAILERLVALNAERVAEEARGVVRWLRPAFQHPETEAIPTQAEIATGAQPSTETVPFAAAKPQAWPSDAIAQVRAVAYTLKASAAPLSVDDITARFKARGPWKKRVPALLDMLVALGRAQEQDGRFRAVQ